MLLEELPEEETILLAGLSADAGVGGGGEAPVWQGYPLRKSVTSPPADRVMTNL